jgi:hypothetical protein
MIDQTAQKEMADVIRAYMNEEIKAFAFSDALDKIDEQTEDRTIKVLVKHLWCCYDDLKNHKIVATKEEWDYFHRVLLVLESGSEIEATVTRKWSFRQPIAACALGMFVILALCLRWGPHLLVAYLTLGLVSMLLSYSRSRATPEPDAVEIASYPFSSMSQVLTARRRISHFSKRRYPSHLTKRRIRHWILEMDLPLPGYLVYGAMWMMFGPVALLLQTMPETDSGTTVVIPQQLEEPSR